jgi:hypothetical protein
MSEPHTQPAPNGPLSRIHIRGWHMLVAATVVVCTLIVVGWATNGDDSREPATTTPATPERLCQLLGRGYTPGMLGYNGMWRAWPDSVSGTQRGLDIGAAALEGGCTSLL